MGNNSSNSSSNSNFFIEPNESVDSVKRQLKCCDHSRLFLYEIVGWYKQISLHRILRFEFHCSNCGSTQYVLIDKTSSKKNISYGYYYLDSPEWWNYVYKPKNNYSFEDIVYY